MSNDVRARYMGNPASLRLEDGTEIELQPRHVYTLPKAVVATRDDFIIQEDEPEKAVDETGEKRKER